jgi:nicotinamidase-related amidase
VLHYFRRGKGQERASAKPGLQCNRLISPIALRFTPRTCMIEKMPYYANLLVMRRPVLIVIDMLNDFLLKWEEGSKARLFSSINGLVTMMRQRGHSIIWVRQEFEPDLRDAFPEMISKGIRITIKGTLGCQIVSDLAIAPSDLVVIKKRYSAFFKTDLDQTLDRLQPDGLVLVGINTHACIRTTAIDAYQRNWRVVLAADCVDSYDRQHHEISLKYLRDKIASVMTNEELRGLLERGRDVAE